MVYFIAIVSAIAGFLFGYDEGIISGSLQLLIKEFSMSNLVTGVLAGALPFGAIFGSLVIGSLLAGKYARVFGRRPLLIVVGLLYTLGGIGIALSPDSAMITLSRAILGLAIGAGAVVTPIFIAESAPALVRGRLVTIYQLAITIGILLAYLINYLLIQVVSWRLIYGTVIIPALILLIGACFLPESPRWLIFRGNLEKARRVLQALRKGVMGYAIDVEFDEIRHAVQTEKPTSWHEVFSPTHRMVVMLGILLFMFQQLSGINTVIYYAPIIFANTGFHGIGSETLATVVLGLVNFLSTILAMFLIERVGRFLLLIIGFAGTAISLGIIFLSSLVHVSYLEWLSLFALITYIISFAISLGPIPYVMMSEIFPLNIRGAGMGLSSMSNWSFNAIIVFIFPLLSAAIGIGNAFGIFALICLIGILFTIRYVPETRGISLEAIEKYVNTGKPLRYLGRNGG